MSRERLGDGCRSGQLIRSIHVYVFVIEDRRHIGTAGHLRKPSLCQAGRILPKAR